MPRNTLFSPISHRLRAMSRPLAGWLRRRADALEPAPPSVRWIRRISLLAVLAMGAWIGATAMPLHYGVVINTLTGALFGVLAFIAAWLAVVLTLAVLRLSRRHLTRAGLAAMAALLFLAGVFGLPGPMELGAGLAAGLAVVLLGAGIGLLHRRPPRPVAALFALLPALIVFGLAAFWLAGDGVDADPVAELIAPAQHEGTEFASLLQAGPYAVESLTYGSGSDRRRAEYAEAVAWTSTPVDAREILGRPQGLGLRLRARWWGFGLDTLPLNGRVWYPRGRQRDLPLVLVVHGNHNMMRFSDPGYAWLGEHLASRGHVVVSVDQNFLNGGVFGDLDRENATRGWLLLEHLAAWRAWSRAPEHPLHGRVDTGQVVLIGHSRGGEAVALAGAFNRLRHFPDNAAVTFDFDFGIQGIAAIAPVDGQFWPSDKPTPLNDLSYFIIHGGHDADISYMVGDRQFRRTRPDIEQGRFSASLYVHHANHGQFNTRWGDRDTVGPGLRLLNRGALLNGADQRRAALLYLTGFVEAALARPRDIPAYFCNAGAAGALLPETLYVTRCDGGQRTVLTDFEDDLDLTSGNLPGVRLAGRDLALWHEGDIGFRGAAPRRQTGVFLGWRKAGGDADGGETSPAYSVELDDSARARLAPSASHVLWLDLAQVDRSPPKPLPNPDDSDGGETDDGAANTAGDEPSSEEKSPLRSPARLTIELEDTRGNRTARPLDDFARLLPPLPVRQTRLKSIDRERYRAATEPVLQSVAIPYAAFAGVDITALRAIRFLFDDTDEGVIVIERIAVERRAGDALPAERAPE